MPAPEMPRENGRSPPPIADGASTESQLQAALAREQVLLDDKEQLAQRAVMLAEEFEHRLINSLQLVSSLLSLQSRTATTPEAAAQLTIAGNRVAALGRVHRRLHLLDHQAHVAFDQYLHQLCDDLSGLLFEKKGATAIVVEADRGDIPTEAAIPLGFIVNELITNSAKHTAGKITVRFATPAPDKYLLSVSDEGSGLPPDFNPKKSKGLGMTIVLSLIARIGGAFHFSSGDNGRGARFQVTFNPMRAGA